MGSKSQGRRPEENRCTANHDGGCGCSRKRKRKNRASGLPNDNYWTGTENSNNTGNSWVVNDNGNNVNVNSNDQSNDNRVVCVP